MGRFYYFSCHLSYAECLVFYTTTLQNALVLDEDGVKVQIPIQNLKKHINGQGLVGRFRLHVDDNNKIISFDRLK